MKVVPLKINDFQQATAFMRNIGTDSYGIKIMAPKTLHCTFKIEEISSFAANIIKQHLLSLGSDAAISRDALTKRIKTSLIIFGTFYQMQKLIDKLKRQPPELKELAYQLENSLNFSTKKVFPFTARNRTLKINKPIICGIVNVTEDSFSGDGLLTKDTKSPFDAVYPERSRRTKGKPSHPSTSLKASQVTSLVLKKVEEMLRYGAKMIDLGGESSRPYSKPVKEEEELKRVIPPLRAIRKRFPKTFISVDTYKYKVAKEAAEWGGVDIINDITALRKCPRIADLVRKYKLGCILMHMKGSPQTMQVNPTYKNVTEDIIGFLDQRINFCLSKGIDRSQLMVDPGVGFGKSLKDNLKILNELYLFKSLGVPVFLGVSRKSFIGKILNVGTKERLTGTIAAAVISFINGAQVLRVHDVREAREALEVTRRILH